ncbi:MAG TPA: zinc ribbon domain-containing protein [Sedimentisphaerales bacterium]|nr:zinc ribbon domain-containing protein [Sedimentisphaerales bacterium]
MPTYEYACGSCGCELERLESIKARPLRKCPKCGRNKLQRLIGTGAGIIFKGSGFYETDYRSESYKKGAESEKKSKEKTRESEKKSTEKTGEKAADKKDKSESKDSKADSKSEATSKKKKKSA